MISSDGELAKHDVLWLATPFFEQGNGEWDKFRGILDVVDYGAADVPEWCLRQRQVLDNDER